MRLRRIDPWLMALIVLQASTLIVLAYLDAPTEGEAVHLCSGIYIWNTGRFDVNLGNPPLVNIIAAAPTALLTPDFQVSHYGGYIEARSLEVSQGHYLTALLLGRLACIPFSIIGAVSCYLWAANASSQFAGRVALSLWCLCPNILGHGHLVTGDVACTAFGVLSGYSIWRWLVDGRFKYAIIAGIMVGLALLTKMVTLLWLGLAPLLWITSLTHAVRDRPTHIRAFTHLLSLFAVAIFVVNLGYMFEGTFRPFPLSSWTRDTNSNETLLLQNASRVIPIPLPENYLRGLRDAHTVMVADTPSYLRGEWRERGWLYYYFYGLFVKVPLGIIVLTIMGLWVFPQTGMSRNDTLFVLIPAICFALAISSLDGLSHHFRYFLPVLPFVYIWVATTSGWISQEVRFGKWAVFGCLTATALATLGQLPHSLAFHNILSGGPLHGHRHMVGTSLDCGQDLHRLRSWLLCHPEVTPLRVVYSGSLAPQLADVEFLHALPGPEIGTSRRRGKLPETWRPESGWYAVSVNQVSGKPSISVGSNGQITWHSQNSWAFFQLLQPVAVVGRTIWIFEVSEYDAGVISQRFGWGPGPP